MIKDRGALGLPTSSYLELLEKHFGDDLCSAKIEPQEICNLYYNHGYATATHSHDLVRHLGEKQRRRPV